MRKRTGRKKRGENINLPGMTGKRNQSFSAIRPSGCSKRRRMCREKKRKVIGGWGSGGGAKQGGRCHFGDCNERR